MKNPTKSPQPAFDRRYNPNTSSRRSGGRAFAVAIACLLVVTALLSNFSGAGSLLWSGTPRQALAQAPANSSDATGVIPVLQGKDRTPTITPGISGPTIMPEVARGDAANVGYQDQSYAPGPSAPTAEKPQSKLWFNDGTWWGSIFNGSTGRYEIYRLDTTTHAWSTTGTIIDARDSSHADTLWDSVSNRLYIATAVLDGSDTDLGVKVLRYSYNSATRLYTLDTGFPVTVATAGVVAVVLDRDSLSRLWITYTKRNSSSSRDVWVAHSTTADNVWGAPFIPPIQNVTNIGADAVSALVSYDGKIGLMWDHGPFSALYFAVHNDTAPDNQWTGPITVVRKADNHINLKSLQADEEGRVYATVKSDYNEGQNTNPEDPLIWLFVLNRTTGTFNTYIVSKVRDEVTRPQVAVNIGNRRVYVFYSTSVNGRPITDANAHLAIYYKEASLDAISFPEGQGTSFIESTTSTKINNASGTKQTLTSQSGVVILAADGVSKFYFHNEIATGGVTPVPTFTASATPSGQTTVTFGAIADARVEAANPSSNFGTSSYLRTDSGTNPEVRSYLRFSVSGVTGPVQNAKLRVYAYNGTSDGPAVYATDNTWTETGITWNNKPALTGPAYDDKGNVPLNTWVEFDVTPLVSANGTYNFVLSQAAADSMYVYSRQGTTPPQLVLTYGSGAPTSTPSSTNTPTFTSTPTATDTVLPGPTTVLTFGSTADARVEAANPANNYGVSSYLRTDAGVNPEVRSYLRFSVSGITGPVQNAKLRVYAYNGTTNGPAVYSTDNTWTETGITWNNKPGMTSAAYDDKGNVPVNTWVEFDVTPLVTGDGTYNFVLSQAAADSMYVYSREGSSPPQLVVTFGGGTAVAGTSTPAASATATTGAETSTPTASATSTSVAGTNTPTSSATATSVAGDIVLVGAGDIATCASTGDERTAALLDNIPGTVFALGDNAYDRGTAAEFANCYHPTWGRHKARTIPVVGNHEYFTDNASPYYNYFGAAAGDPTKGYYSQNVGSGANVWHIVVLNSNCTFVPCATGSAQEQWFRADLAANLDKNTIVMWHHPRFSSGSLHRDDPSVQAFWQASYDYGVDLVLVGHAHGYERFAPQNAVAGLDTTYGIRQFVVGTGGKSHQGFDDPPSANSELREGGTYGVLKLTLHTNSYDWLFVSEAGDPFTDSGTTLTHGTPAPPTATPTATATPTGQTAVTFGAIADARVESANPASNFGTSSYLRTDSGTNPEVRSYLRFSVSGITGPVQNAKLRVYAYNGTTNGPAVYSTDNTWTETGITWNNKPGMTSAAYDDKGNVPVNTWVEFDVTPLVTGDGTYNFVLSQAAADSMYAYAREGSSPPQLVVTYVPNRR